MQGTVFLFKVDVSYFKFAIKPVKSLSILLVVLNEAQGNDIQKIGAAKKEKHIPPIKTFIAEPRFS